MISLTPHTAIAAIFYGTAVKPPNASLYRRCIDVFNHGHVDALPDGDEAYHSNFFSMATRGMLAGRKEPEKTTGTETVDRYLGE
jgi:hypothetical protein